MIIRIHEYIKQRLDDGATPQELSDLMGVSTAMVSKYKANIGYKPSINVAMAIYELDKVVLHPFAEESLQEEINELARTK